MCYWYHPNMKDQKPEPFMKGKTECQCSGMGWLSTKRKKTWFKQATLQRDSPPSRTLNTSLPTSQSPHFSYLPS